MTQPKIPTIVGLMLVLGAVFLFSLAFDRITPLLSRASPTLKPKQVTFSNITDTSYSVTWMTDVPATGALIVDGSSIGTYYDERDEKSASNEKTAVLGKYTIHSIVVRNAQPQTTYNIRILSDGTIYQNGATPYTVTTGTTLPGTGINLEPAYGTVTLPTGQPADGAIVYLTLEGGQILSAFTTSTGSWVVPLHLARTQALSSYIQVTDRMTESILVRSIQGDAVATTDTINDNPVPAMVIGKSYDYRKIQALQTTPSPEPQLAQAPPAVLGVSTVENPIVAITQPSQGAALTSTLPLIQGTGVPNKQVLIIVGITQPLSASVTVGEDGIWRYTPSHVLSEGKQSVTISTRDKNDKPVAMTHTFEVLKSGTQVLGDATPSATLIPTPTLEITPTLESTPSPTATLAGQPLPTSGNETPTFILIALGLGLFVSGMVVLVL